MFISESLKNFKAFIFILLVICIYAFKVQPGQLYQTTNGKIDFKSDAPLEIIRATSNDLAGLLDIGRNNFSFKIIIRSFQGFNSPLQKEHFNENYMESDKYPDASFKGKIIEDVDLSVAGNYQVRAKGIMVIHNVPQERIIKTDVTVKENTIIVHSEFTVLLSDHNIPIPKVVNQKLADEIKVEMNATFKPR